MIKEWNEFYKEWTKEDYFQHIKAWKGFCHRIARFTPKGETILEVGYGTGQMSIYLSTMGYEMTGIDDDPIQSLRARKLSKKIGEEVMFCFGDIFYPPFHSNNFHTVFSQGLLEHFPDDKIKEILKIKFRLGKVVAFSIPLDKFGHQSRGDERLLPESHWKELVKDYKILHWSTFANESQLICIIEEKV